LTHRCAITAEHPPREAIPIALAIVQARLSSTRLPGKTLADVGGEPLLALVLRRLARAEEVEQIVVATSVEPLDDPIDEVARQLGHGVYRGPLDDVLARFVGAAPKHRGPLVRITADCPLIDPTIVDEVVRLFDRTPDCEYASNIEPKRTYPKGLDTEVFSFDVLERISAETTDPLHREHVTLLVRKNLSQFRIAALTANEELGDVDWSVDTRDDLEFVRKVVARLGEQRYAAGMQEILAAVRQEPSLADFRGRRG
jgi:spore coat polysaccharide biosynthesis protein SpsF (cytidylyltransferase family)